MSDPGADQTDITVGEKGPLAFLFLGGGAMGWYVMARRGLQLGYGFSSIIAAHQAIELLIKVVVQQHDLKDTGQHRLASSMRKHSRRIPAFEQLMADPRRARFLEQLSEAYYRLRYGEAFSEAHHSNIVQLLDEIVFALWTLYLKTLNLPQARFYVHQDDRAVLLQDNRFFTADHISASRLAMWGPTNLGDSLPGF